MIEFLRPGNLNRKALQHVSDGGIIIIRLDSGLVRPGSEGGHKCPNLNG